MEEATYETRGSLHPVFIETTAHQQASSKNIPLLYLLGRKGTGKSSVLNKIAHDSSPNSLYFYFEKFHSVIQERVRQSLPAQASNSELHHTNYRQEWEVVLWIQIVRHLYFKYRQKKTFHLLDEGKYLLLFDFLDKNKLPVPLNITSKVVRFPQRLKTVEIKDVKIEIAEEKYSPKSSSVYHLDSIKEAVASLLEESPIFLIVDEIDHIPELNKDAKLSILGLIEALNSVIRDINLSQAKNHGLLVRVAIRKDMLEVVTKNYGSAQILRREEIDPSWSNEQMEELVVRRVRDYWKLPSTAISRQKILAEIFPVRLKTNEKPFEYFSWLSRENPRSLFLLINLVLQKSVNRQKAYIASKDIYPVCTTLNDFEEVLLEYSRLQYDFQLGGLFLLYPGLDRVVDILKHKKKEIFFTGATRTSISNILNTAFKKEKDLKTLVESWTHREISSVSKIIQILYEARLIGCKNGNKIMYSPNAIKNSGTLLFHPVFQWDLFKTKPATIKKNSVEQFRKARLRVLESVDNFLKKEIDSLRNRKIPVKGKQLSKSYKQGDLAFGFIGCLWSIRHLAKILIAHGLDIGFSQDRIQVVLSDLEKIWKELANLVNSTVDDLHLASILVNSSADGLISDKMTFTKEMKAEENYNIYSHCLRGIDSWSAPLKDTSLAIETLEKRIENIRVDQLEIENQFESGSITEKDFSKQMKEIDRQKNDLVKQLRHQEVTREQLTNPLEKIFDRLTALCQLLENEENYA